MKGAFTVKLYNPASAVRCYASKFDEQLFHVRYTRVLYVHGMCLIISFKDSFSFFSVCCRHDPCTKEYVRLNPYSKGVYMLERIARKNNDLIIS